MKPPTALCLTGNSSAPNALPPGTSNATRGQWNPPGIWIESLEPRQHLTAGPIMAATINLDRHFGHHGYATATLPWHDGRAIFMNDLEATADGKIYATATMDTATGLTNDVVVGRFNPDGQPDQTFADHGVLIATIDG